jgi:hypothetical protein
VVEAIGGSENGPKGQTDKEFKRRRGDRRIAKKRRLEEMTVAR